MGASDRRELRNRLNTIMVHLFKLRFGHDARPRGGSVETIGEQRNRLRVLLDDNRSLRRDLDAYVARETDAARELARQALAGYGDAGRIDPDAAFTAGQVLGDWWPDRA